MRILGVTMLAVVFLATACVLHGVEAGKTAKSRHFVVELKPKRTPAKAELEIKTGPQGFRNSGKKNGYVGFDEGEAGTIIFSLRGEGLGDFCAPAGDADWVITRIELSAAGDPETEKGDGFGERQPAWLKLAFPDVDLDSGLVHFADVAEAPTTVAIRDANEQQGEQSIFYQVTATECASPHASVITDPMVRNKGK